MIALPIQAELQKFARTLGCPEKELTGLAILELTRLRRLRQAASAALFEGDRAMLHRVAASTRLLPRGVAALIAEKALGATLCARVAGLLQPQDAVEIARRTPISFNTEVTLQLDPRSAGPMLKLMPVDLVVGVSKQLSARREFIAMADFVELLTDEAIRAVMAVLDDETLLRIGFYVESSQRLEELVDMMSAQRLSKTVALSTSEKLNLGAEIMAMLGGVSERLRLRLIEAAVAHPDASVLARLLEIAREHGMLEVLQPLIERVSKSKRG